MGSRFMNQSLDLGMIINHRLPASHRTKALNHVNDNHNSDRGDLSINDITIITTQTHTRTC
jgi:hypothetical protein